MESKVLVRGSRGGDSYWSHDVLVCQSMCVVDMLIMYVGWIEGIKGWELCVGI